MSAKQFTRRNILTLLTAGALFPIAAVGVAKHKELRGTLAQPVMKTGCICGTCYEDKFGRTMFKLQDGTFSYNDPDAREYEV